MSELVPMCHAERELCHGLTYYGTFNFFPFVKVGMTVGREDVQSLQYIKIQCLTVPN